MSQTIDLKKIERKVYMSFHQDGLLDLFIGLTFIAIIVFFEIGIPGMAAIIPALAIILVPLLKKIIVAPRLGYVKFSPEREIREKQKKSWLTIFFTITAVLGAVVLFGYSGDAAWQRAIKSLELLPFGLVLAMVAGILGYLYNIKRGYVYAVLIAVLFLVGYFVRLHLPIYFAVLGVAMFPTGLIMFIRFISKYPRPPEEGTNEI